MPIQGFIYNLLFIIDQVLVPLIFSIAFIVFLWGVAQFFIISAGDEKKREEGKKFLLWGIIGFFVMFSVWGIVNLFINTLGFGGAPRPDLPLFGPSFGGSGFYGGGGFFGSGQPQGIPAGSGAVSGPCGFLGFCGHGYDCVNGMCTDVDGT